MSDQSAASAEGLDQEVRLRVFRQTAATTRAPTPEEIAAVLGRPRLEVEESLRRLAANRLLVLAPATSNIWMAPPFCAVPTDFRWWENIAFA